MPRHEKEANAGLIETQFGAINKAFFTDADPSGYFDTRLRVILQLRDPKSLARKAVNEPVLGLVNGDKDVVDEKYLATEVMNLFHHAAECLWRMILIFDKKPVCPQLELARFGMKEYREQLEAFLALPESDRSDRIAHVFGYQKAGDEADDPMADEIVSAIERLASAYGRSIRSEAALYNSSKHGMSMSGSKSRIALFVNGQDDTEAEARTAPTPEQKPGQDAIFSRDAMWLSCLDTIDRDGRWKWAFVRTAIDVDEMIRNTGMCINLIRVLWGVAKNDYLGEEVPPLGVPSKAVADELLDGNPARIGHVEHDLKYEGLQENITMNIVDVMLPTDHPLASDD